MLAHDLLDDLDRRGEEALRPLYLVLGEESFLADEVVRRLRQTTGLGGIEGFNVDVFAAQEAHVEVVLAAAKSVPMMAKRRFVLVRGLERWEGRAEEDGAPVRGKGAGKTEPPLDKLAAYAADPCPSAVLVLVAEKLHPSRRLVTAGKKGGFLVACDPLRRGEPGPWVAARAKKLGHPMSRDVAENVADLIGADLGALADAVERLGLYVGEGAPISEDAVAEMIAPVRTSATWFLNDAICARDLGKAMRVLGEMELGRGTELMTLGAIASSIRKLVHFADELHRGGNPQAAAEASGIPTFKARETQQSIRSLPKGTLERWLELCAATDVALKGGERRGGRSILEGMIVSMCSR